MRSHIRYIFIGLTVLFASTAFADVYIGDRFVTTTNFRVVWNSGNDVEAITQLFWKGGPNLTGSFALNTCNNGDVEYFGNAWAPPDPGAGGLVLVGGGTTTKGWIASRAGGGDSHGVVQITSASTGCSPSSAGVPVNTTYTFDDAPASRNLFVMQRQFNFGNKPFTSNFRPYIPRLSLGLGFTHVYYPAVGGTLAVVDARNCPTGCTGPFTTPGAAQLDAAWDSNQQWYAIHNPTTGQGMVVLRQRSYDANGSMIRSQIWIDWDGGSNTNSSSILLMAPGNGFLGQIVENETFCFYDAKSWTPSLTPPPGCQPPENADWPQILHDAGRSGYNPGEKTIGLSNVGSLEVKWTRLVEYQAAPLLVANGMLYYVGTWEGSEESIFAVDQASGALVWSFALDQFPAETCSEMGNLMAVDRGMLVGTCPAQNLWATFGIDATTGEIRFMRAVRAAAAGGVLYGDTYGMINESVFAEKFDGSELWSFKIFNLYQCGYNFLCYTDGLPAFNVDTAVWSISGPPCYRSLLAMNAPDGIMRWQSDWIPSCNIQEPTASAVAVYTVADGTLYAFDMSSGKQLWSQPGLGRPIVTGEMGYADCGADLCAFKTADGKLLWTAPDGGKPVAAANGVVYANGAFDARTGRRIGSVSGIVANGMVYTNDGFVITAYGPHK